MNDPRPFASLSSGLLARKGAARPAMRPQGFGPHSEQSVKLYFELKDLKASGYHIAIFYP